MGVPLRGHQRIDQRSLALHRAIAGKLREGPTLIAIALENIERWTRAGSRSQPYWDAWREILSRPLPETLDVMVEESEHMTALRQATPFAGVLTARERWAIYERFPLGKAASS
ncbi:MAG TPA: hypothetical protein VMQ86_25145 [Bryobacteraceae bacterium]|jgi:hypothetical protein|nr:hypothetical protein [Bryobacteraceae bacterium]